MASRLRKPLILLHGALGSAEQLSSLASALGDAHELHVPDLPGHGDEPLGDQPFELSSFVTSMHDYIRAHRLQRPLIFGHSMGGAVALMLALENPCCLSGIVTLGTKLRWTPEIASRECAFLDPERIEAKVPAFARTLERRHRALGWKTVLRHTEALTLNLGVRPPISVERFAELDLPVIVGAAERDHLVPCEETKWAAAHMPRAEAWTIPGAHALESVESAALAGVISDFALAACR